MSVNKDSKYHSLSKEVYEQILGDREHGKINPYACKDSDIIRRQPDHDAPHLWRPAFVMDVEKILHNNYYNRYSDKTQVISCYKNDDISRRALHVQLVSRIARTIGMTLGLNLDLIEAISLGHDIGHTPFGHAGERYLNEIYNEHTGRLFNHNIHSARVLDKLIFRNISLQVLDGVICHNGEMEQQCYTPKTFNADDPWGEFDRSVEDCYTDPSANKKQIPGTLEGCIMRISDIIAYLGKDRQDAIKIGLIPNDDRMYNDNIKPMFYCIYEELLRQAKSKGTDSILYKHHVNYIKDANRYSNYFGKKEFIDNYLSQDPNEIVVDFIASMTDDYFIDLYEYLFPNGTYKVDYVGYFDNI